MDQYADRIPFASSLTNLIILIAKYTLNISRPQTSGFLAHIYKKSVERSTILLFPILGNILIYHRDRDEAKILEARLAEFKTRARRIIDSIKLNDNWCQDTAILASIVTKLDLDWTLAAAKNGDPDSMCFIAQRLILKKQLDSGIALLLEGAKQSHIGSLNTIDLMIGILLRCALFKRDKNAIHCVVCYFSHLSTRYLDEYRLDPASLKPESLVIYFTLMKLADKCNEETDDPDLAMLSRIAALLAKKWKLLN